MLEVRTVRPDSISYFMIDFKHVGDFLRNAFHLKLMQSILHIVMLANSDNLHESTWSFVKNTVNECVIIIVMKRVTQAISWEDYFW